MPEVNESLRVRRSKLRIIPALETYSNSRGLFLPNPVGPKSRSRYSHDVVSVMPFLFNMYVVE